MAWLNATAEWILTANRNEVSYDWVKYEGAAWLAYPLFQQREHRTTETTHESRGLKESVTLPAAAITETRDAQLRLTSTSTTVYSRSRANDAGAYTITRTVTTQIINYLNRFKWDPEGRLEEGVVPPST